jgi:hypothetical protein
MGAKNNRRVKKANHGKRACGHFGRRKKAIRTPR